MRGKLKIDFADFVSRFDPYDNYFFNLLSKDYEVEISQNPDILFCSCYGFERYKYNCLKIYYTGENQRPDFKENDFALTFDFCSDPRHYRLPLYALYIEQAEGQRKKGRIFNEFSQIESITDSLCRYRTRDEAARAWRSKKEFCCILNSNPSAQLRVNLFKKLSKYKLVASGGSVLNNLGYAVKDKIDFVRDYRFVFAMENFSREGYTTEKIVEPFFVDSIPLYWGSKSVHLDFNPSSFINYHDYENDDEFIERVIELDRNEDLAIEMLMQPKFSNGIVNEFINEKNVKAFLHHIIENREELMPVSATFSGRYQNAKRIFQHKKTDIVSKIKSTIKKL